MYTKNKSIGAKKQDLSNYIEGYDVYNSKLLEVLRNSNIETENYTITNNEYRPDLIAKDYYGDEIYTGILIITCGIGLDGYSKGTVLNLIPKSTIDKILEYEI